MSVFEILVLALALAADAFSVGAAVGATSTRPRQIFRLSFHFGLFQALMPLLGMGFGVWLADVAGRWSGALAGGILIVIGARMIREAMTHGESKPEKRDPTRGFSLVGLSTAVSIDAFGAGIGLATGKAPVLFSVVLIGVVSGLVTFFAMRLSRFITKRFGRGAEIFGGVVLVGLGLRMAAGG